MQKIFKRWKIIAAKIASFQARVLLSILYIFCIIPVALFIKIVRPDVLQGQSSVIRKNSFWHKRKKIINNKIHAKRQ